MSTTQQAIFNGRVVGDADRCVVLGTRREAIEAMWLAYGYGYRRGWSRGLFMGLAVVGVGVLCILVVILT